MSIQFRNLINMDGNRTSAIAWLPRRYLVLYAVASCCWLHITTAHTEESVTQLLSGLEGNDTKAHNVIYKKFKAMGKRAVPALQKALQDSKADVRINAASALGQIGEDARDAWPSLEALWSDKNAEVREQVLMTMDYIAPLETVMPFVRKAMKDDATDVRVEACTILFRNGKIAGAHVGLALDMLKDTDAKVRSEAALALGEIGPVNSQVIPALIATLKDASNRVSYEAASALGEIGAPATDAIPILSALAAKKTAKDWQLSGAAEMAVKKIRASNAAKARLDNAPTYVMKDGRRIKALNTIETNDSYSLQSEGGKFVEIKKSDVIEIIKPVENLKSK